MATIVSYLAPTNNTDANFRLWTKGIHDAIIALGWTQTADTGQINFATVLAPVAINTLAGYTIYAMADALQATAPCYLRVGWASSNPATIPAMRFQIGTGTNGAGTLTGNTTAQRTLNTGTSSTTLYTCLFSGTTNRLTLGIWADAGSLYQFLINIERDLDSSGVVTSTGIGYRSTGLNSNAVSYQQFLPSTGAVPAEEPQWLCMGPFVSAVAVGQNLSSISGLRQAYGPLRNPEIGVMSCTGQFAPNAPVVLTRYGVSRTYFLYPGTGYSGNGWSYGNLGKWLMLWE